MVRKRNLKKTQKKVNKTLKKNVRKKNVKRYNKKTKKQSGGWVKAWYDRRKEKKQRKQRSNFNNTTLEELTSELTDQHALTQLEKDRVLIDTLEEEVLRPLRLVYTHSGRIMCILYSLFLGNSDAIEQLVIKVDKQGKFYNNCVVELLFNKKSDSDGYNLIVKLALSGNIFDKGGKKRLCSEKDTHDNLKICQEFATQVISIRENDIHKVIPKVILDMIGRNIYTRVMLIRHGEAEHNVSIKKNKKRVKTITEEAKKNDENRLGNDNQAGVGKKLDRLAEAAAGLVRVAAPVATGVGVAMNTVGVSTGLGVAAIPVAAAAVGVGTVAAIPVAAGLGYLYHKATTTDRGYIQDSDLTPDGIESVERTALNLFSYLMGVGYTDIDKLSHNLETYVSMLKRTFHTAALFNGVLLMKYKGQQMVPPGWDQFYNSPSLYDGVVEMNDKLKGLTKFHVRANLGEITGDQVGKATFENRKQWKNSSNGDMWSYNQTDCADAHKSETKLETKPKKNMSRLNFHQNLIPCSTYENVETVILVSMDDLMKTERNNKCNNPPPDSSSNVIKQYTHTDVLDGLKFTLSQSVKKVYDKLQLQPAPEKITKGGSNTKRKLKTKKRLKI